MMKKRNCRKKNVQFFAAAALTVVLMAGQIQIVPVYGENSGIQVSSLIPDNVTIEQPVPLSDISLPDSSYGTLSWADGSLVPSERVQSFDVVFRPYDSADLAKISGWDGTSDAIYSSVTVVVNSFSDEEEWTEDEGESEEWYEDGYTEDEDYGSESGENEDEGNVESGDSDASQDDTGEEGQPEITEIPDETEDSGQEGDPDIPSEQTPEVTEAPEVTEIPEVTVTPEVTAVPEITTEPGAEVSPAPSEIPEEKTEITVTPEVTVTPEATVAPSISETPEPTVTVDEDSDNIFDRNEENMEETRPDQVETNLTDEKKEEIAAQNHTCAGITVSGISLPWYVQFRVSSGDNYEFSNESEANIFKSYEFELWNLKDNTEYEIPDGEYISVTVPVKEGYDYTIEHLLDNGALETIVPSVSGSTMIFSTHSFSPFGIAGSKTLVGEEIENDGYNESASSGVTVTPTSSQTAETSEDSASSSAEVTRSASSAKSSTQSSTDEAGSGEDSSDSADAVNTGDTTPILPFVILAIAAVVIIGAIIYLRKRKK